MVINCSGCGAQLQNYDENKIGYTPAKELKKDVICMRCFKLKNYSEVIDYDVSPDKYRSILKQIEKKSSLIVVILDINDLHSAQKTLDYFKEHENKIFLFNKVDILPKSKKKSFFENYLSSVLKYLDGEIMVMSANKKQDIGILRNYLNNSEHRHIYFVGSANVGKSTILNKILESEKNILKPVVSSLPGTTYNVINIKTEHKLFTDTPGLIDENSTLYNINYKLIKKVLPVKEIKPKMFQLNEQQTIFIENYAIFNFESGKRNGFNCFFSNEIELHRTASKNYDKYFNNHFIEACKESYKHEFEMKKVVMNFEAKTEKYDIVIDGLGWISFYADSDLVISIEVPNFVNVSSRLAIV